MPGILTRLQHVIQQRPHPPTQNRGEAVRSPSKLWVPKIGLKLRTQSINSSFSCGEFGALVGGSAMARNHCPIIGSLRNSHLQSLYTCAWAPTPHSLPGGIKKNPETDRTKCTENPRCVLETP